MRGSEKVMRSAMHGAGKPNFKRGCHVRSNQDRW